MRLPDQRITDPLARAFLYKGSSETGVLLIHGFTGTAAEMRPSGEVLRDAGYTVHGILLPGHGENLPAMIQTGWQDWLRAAREACVELMGRCRRVFVCGLSMGGVLALLLAEELPITAAIPIAAPMEVYSRLLRWTWLLQYIHPYQGWIPTEGDGQPKKKGPYNIGYAGTPTCKVPDLVHLMDDARRNLDRITCPLLIIQSLKDQTVKPVSAEIISQGAVHALPRNILYLQTSPHVCTTGEELPLIVSRVLDFIEEPLRG